jgi:hypothetical protein
MKMMVSGGTYLTNFYSPNTSALPQVRGTLALTDARTPVTNDSSDVTGSSQRHWQGFRTLEQQQAAMTAHLLP